MTQLSIVIPAYNEARRIMPTLQHYLEYYAGTATELIVVLNGCRDQTLEIVQAFQARHHEQLRYIEIQEPLGKGGAVKAGLLSAIGRYRGFIDADESTTPEEFQKLVNVLYESHTDGVIASRWMPQSTILNRDSLLRKLASKIFAFIVRHRFHMPFHDTQCGAKVFRADLVTDIVPRMIIQNMTFDVELLYKAFHHGYGIIEVPTVWVDKTSSVMFNSPGQLLRKAFAMYHSLWSIKKYRTYD